MKKLLFFAMVLFGLLGIQLMANFDPSTNTYNYGCGPGVPPSVCGADRTGNGGSGSSVTYYGAIAVNPHTRKVFYSYNYTSQKEAEASVLKACNDVSCEFTWGSVQYLTIAISEDDKSTGYGGSNDYDEARNLAISKCEKSGKKCYLAAVGFPSKKGIKMFWGGVAYNPQTGLVGKSTNSLRKYEAENTVLKNAGCNDNTNCYFYVFQDWYGALAKSESGKVYIGSSNKSKRDAEKQAEKNCKNKKNGEKNCKALVSSERDNGK